MIRLLWLSPPYVWKAVVVAARWLWCVLVVWHSWDVQQGEKCVCQFRQCKRCGVIGPRDTCGLHFMWRL
jgi:hypothetical protein